MNTPKFWMITNRNRKDTTLGRDRAGLSYWLSDKGPLDRLNNWSAVSPKGFKDALIDAAGQYPVITDPGGHMDQKHVTVFVHGYNNDWTDAARRYQQICDDLYPGKNGLGLCILFTWPADGSPLHYLPDRADARESAIDLASVLCKFYDWLLLKQAEAAGNPQDPTKGCHVKTSLIAHSMGNYLVQKAMQLAWTRNNQPLLVSLLNQVLMVAADVDNDLFKSGETSDKSDGDAMANLCYRITALYTGRDSVLGMSAGLKHFGKRRLGRSGLDRSAPAPDNVWDADCSLLIPKDHDNIHSAYFEAQKTQELMRHVLRGSDRGVIENSFGKLIPRR